MDELPDDQVKAALSQALSAINRAKEPTKTRLPMDQLNNVLAQAVSSFEPSPSPSPFPTDQLGNRLTPPIPGRGGG